MALAVGAALLVLLRLWRDTPIDAHAGRAGWGQSRRERDLEARLSYLEDKVNGMFNMVCLHSELQFDGPCVCVLVWVGASVWCAWRECSVVTT